MQSTYFKPSDLRKVECVVNNITRSGSAFAVSESGDHVFIPVRLADDFKIDVGDMLVCHCIDQHLPENAGEEKVSARYRAIRVKVTQRLVDLDDDAEVVTPALALTLESVMAPPPPPPKPVLEKQALKGMLMVAIQAPKAWSSKDMAEHLVEASGTQYEIPEDFTQKVSAMLWHEHEMGNIAAVNVMQRRDQERPSLVFYARSMEVFRDLLDGYELDE